MKKIYRLNPLLEVLRASPKRINKIFVQKEKFQDKLSEIIQIARTNQIPCLFVPKQKLDTLAPRHQGVVALFALKDFSTLDEIIKPAALPFLVLLDGIEDPQNFGAIIRSSVSAGVDGLIIPERRSVGLTETVSRISAGALEYCKVARVKNLGRTMDDLKKRGIWLVGAEGGMDELWHEFDYTVPIGLVFGSEGRGLRPLIKTKCDKVLSLPLCGNISSLNVASAAAVFIFEVIRQRKTKKNE